jgi:hypothetical protein
MIELLLPYGFDTMEYCWVKATIGICMLADYSVSKKHQQHVANSATVIYLRLTRFCSYSCMTTDAGQPDSAMEHKGKRDYSP